jgi:hypothetical protein
MNVWLKILFKKTDPVTLVVLVLGYLLLANMGLAPTKQEVNELDRRVLRVEVWLYATGGDTLMFVGPIPR